MAIFKACTVICKSNILLIVEQVGTLVNWPMCDFFFINLYKLFSYLISDISFSDLIYAIEIKKIKT